MKERNKITQIQCKDIDERPILEFLLKRYEEHLGWASCFGDEFENSVTHAMPKDIPFKVVVRKMAKMIAKGLVDGCGCGCRGDYEITQKGKDSLNEIKGN